MPRWSAGPRRSRDACRSAAGGRSGSSAVPICRTGGALCMRRHFCGCGRWRSTARRRSFRASSSTSCSISYGRMRAIRCDGRTRTWCARSSIRAFAVSLAGRRSGGRWRWTAGTSAPGRGAGETTAARVSATRRRGCTPGQPGTPSSHLFPAGGRRVAGGSRANWEKGLCRYN